MSRRQSLHLRLELLRMRGQIERAEVAAALVELRTGTRRIGALANTVSSVAGAFTGGGVGSALEALGAARGLWAPLALALVRAIRRHPAAAVVLTAGALALVGWWAGRKPRRTAPDEPGDA